MLGRLNLKIEVHHRSTDEPRLMVGISSNILNDPVNGL